MENSVNDQLNSIIFYFVNNLILIFSSVHLDEVITKKTSSCRISQRENVINILVFSSFAESQWADGIKTASHQYRFNVASIGYQWRMSTEKNPIKFSVF